MASIQNDARFFGFDLSGLGQDILMAWRGMARWRVFAWLQPRVPVRVVLADGTIACSLGPDKPLDAKAKMPAKFGFDAIQLPEDVLLRRTVVLPVLDPAESVAALALEALALSPFSSEQLLWVSCPIDLQSDAYELVLTSRALVQQYLETVHTAIQSLAVQAQQPELWVPIAGDTHMVLPGFGELRRQQHIRNGFRINLGLLVFAFGLMAAIALSPTLQMRLRAIDAVSQHSALRVQVAPVLLQREAYIKAQEQLQYLNDAMGVPVSAIHVLDVVTRAVPNDTSVLTLQLQPAEASSKAVHVQITGQTTNAAALMQQLGQQQGVRDVKAPTPAVKPPGAAKESFAVEFSVSMPSPGLVP